jgi:hypothetical protein
MCDHDIRWARERHAVLLSTQDAKLLDAPEGGPSATPEVYSFKSQVGTSILDAEFLVWSPLTKAYKDRLWFDDAFDRGGEFRYKRASLNESLKEVLINRCLIDAVAYAGPNGDSIRHWMKEKVCERLGGSIHSGECRIPDNVPAPRTVIVAESLGSKVVFDAIRDIWRESSGRARANVAEQLRSVQSIFLLANQIPLLDAADRNDKALTAKGTDSTFGFLEDFEEARAPLAFSKAASLPTLHVVAFSDPNDLLSYRLKDDNLFQTNIRIVNVIVSNAPTYLGIVERPDDAHCGYKWNRFVVGTLVDGYDGRKLIPTQVELEKKCGLVGGDSES